MPSRPDCLLFDLDGTLVDSVPDLTHSLNLLRAELDLSPLTSLQVSAMVGDGVKLLVSRALGAKLYCEDHCRRFMNIYADHLLDKTCCYPGIPELLQAHRQHKMAVITNKPADLARRLLAGLDLERYFPVILGGDSLPRRKPDPLPVISALRQLAAEPTQAVMIGDHHTDLRAGQRAGTATCFCAYGVGHSDGLPSDYQANRSQDLLGLFPG